MQVHLEKNLYFWILLLFIHLMQVVFKHDKKFSEWSQIYFIE